MATTASFEECSAALSDALQALLSAAVVFATDAGKDAQHLHSATARFDSIASALETDLLARASAMQPCVRSLPTGLLRTLAEREESAALGQ